MAELDIVLESSGNGLLEINDENNFDLIMDQDGSMDLILDTSAGECHHEVYRGPYTVYPDPTDIQILQTENKLMTQNVLALPIPYYRTENLSGGDTIYIGD